MDTNMCNIKCAQRNGNASENARSATEFQQKNKNLGEESEFMNENQNLGKEPEFRKKNKKEKKK